MFKNYLKIALRNIKNEKGYSFINIFGLAVGMSVCILILLWVQTELSTESFHKNIDNLYRVYQNNAYSGNKDFTTPCVSGPIAAVMKKKYAEVKEVSRFLDSGPRTIQYKKKLFIEKGICLTDPSFLKMFTFPAKRGNAIDSLNNPYSVLLTQEMASKYFGKLDPIGQVMIIDNKYEFKVTGILKNIPENTHLSNINFLIPFIHSKELVKDSFEEWTHYWPFTYIQLAEGINSNEFGKKIKHIISNNSKSKTDLYIQPVKNIGLFTLKGKKAKILTIYIFSLIAFIVLIIGCINFINLTTAKSIKRAREIGLRKVLGAEKKNIIYQFLGEYGLLSIITLVFSLAITILFLPSFNKLTGKEMSLNLFNNPGLVIIIAGISIFTGLAAGVYPAFYLSKFQPVKVLKNKLNASRKSGFRSSLVLFQFSISIILIICTFAINKQMNFIKTMDLGYEKDQLLYINLNGDSKKSINIIKNELNKNKNILKTTIASILPIREGNSTTYFDWEGKKSGEKILFNQVCTDSNYINAIGANLIKGRDFSKTDTYSENKVNSFILNEEAVKRIGLKSPIGKRFSYIGQKGKIIGVLKNFHFSSLKRKISPMVIFVDPKEANFLLIRTNPEFLSKVLVEIKKIWKSLIPGVPFTYGFIDDAVKNLYRFEKKKKELIFYFAFLAILIANLGLIGLVMFMVKQKIKEIGIRKVLGASVFSIINNLSKDLLKWVLVANIIAWPIAYYSINSWQKSFAYKTPISFQIFIFSGILSFIMAIATVSFQSIKAARANPIKSLKYE